MRNRLQLMNPFINLPDPRSYGMQELPSASAERALVRQMLTRQADGDSEAEKNIASKALYQHLSHGLAYTTGSALGCLPPSTDTCLKAFLITNKAGLTEGGRAWTKHFHRSIPTLDGNGEGELPGSKRRKKADVEASVGWWGIASGSVATINEKALALFWKVVNGATWRNLHWLPHEVLVYEVRVDEGYGMRWSQHRALKGSGEETQTDSEEVGRPWEFRGFVEPMIENGHEVGWKHCHREVPYFLGFNTKNSQRAGRFGLATGELLMPFIPSLCPLRHCEADMQIEQATMLMPYYLYQPNYFGILLLGGSDCYLANERGFPDLKPLDKFAPSAIHEGSECVVEDLSPDPMRSFASPTVYEMVLDALLRRSRSVMGMLNVSSRCTYLWDFANYVCS